jgi:hypothetical protein
VPAEHAAVWSSLQDAVVAGHLKPATYQRLMVAILAKNCLYLAAFALVRAAAAAAVPCSSSSCAAQQHVNVRTKGQLTQTAASTM